MDITLLRPSQVVVVRSIPFHLLMMAVRKELSTRPLEPFPLGQPGPDASAFSAEVSRPDERGAGLPVEELLL